MSLFNEKVVWAKGRWERRDYATIMSGRVVRYTMGRDSSVEVSASRDAVCIDGVGITSEEGRTLFLEIVARAWRQHRHLALAHGYDPIDEPETI